MSPWLAATAGLLSVWSAGYVGTCGTALWRARRRVPQPQATDAPSVLLVRPCTGTPPSLRRALRSTSRLAYRGRLRVLLSVDSPRDPAWPEVRRAARRLRDDGLDAHAVLAPTEASNRKVGQLATLTGDATEDVVVCVDADVHLTGFDLGALLAPMEHDRSCAATWAPPVEVGRPKTLGDRASAAILGASLHAFPLLGGLDPGGLVGKLFAVRTAALQAVGGFAALSAHLGEDMELARRLRARGWHTRMYPGTARALAGGRSLASVVERQTRWLWVIRAQRPRLLASYPLLFAASPLLLGTLVALAVFLPGWAGVLSALVLGARLAVAGRASAPRGRWRAALTFEWLLADALLLIAFVRVLGARRVSWGGRTLELGRDGRLEPLRPSLDRPRLPGKQPPREPVQAPGTPSPGGRGRQEGLEASAVL